MLDSSVFEAEAPGYRDYRKANYTETAAFLAVVLIDAFLDLAGNLGAGREGEDIVLGFIGKIGFELSKDLSFQQVTIVWIVFPVESARPAGGITVVAQISESFVEAWIELSPDRNCALRNFIEAIHRGEV
jgi:hypothetical protein